MKKIKKLTSLLFCCLFLYLLAFPGQVQAASLTPTAQDNLSVKLRRSSDLISISNGYMRVFRKTNSVGIEYHHVLLRRVRYLQYSPLRAWYPHHVQPL